ncbi:hypothetical protein, partial [Paenibacillus tyrfis]|uniref:hypothetical protein n=1 Tax=Paenibacillus tyrfis TaxID=1501230 RepID=UPI0020A07881
VIYVFIEALEMVSVQFQQAACLLFLSPSLPWIGSYLENISCQGNLQLVVRSKVKSVGRQLQAKHSKDLRTKETA